MKTSHLARGATLALVALLPAAALALPPKIHIYVANAMHDNLDRHGEYIELMSPDGKKVTKVPIPRAHADAILNALPYFRAGAVGPDNTVFTKLTDISHVPDYRPFMQCEALYQEALARAEREPNEEEPLKGGTKGMKKAQQQELAYALGCFVHGIADNVCHHVVNYFSGESFTFYPKDLPDAEADEESADGGPKKSYANMVRHILVELPFEKHLFAQEDKARTNDKGQRLDTRPGLTDEPLTAARLKRDAEKLRKNPTLADTHGKDYAMLHTLPMALIQRVYFDPTNCSKTGLWRHLIGDLIEKKKLALIRALNEQRGANIDAACAEEPVCEDGKPVDPLQSCIFTALRDANEREDNVEEDLKEHPWKTDKTMIEAYAKFLTDEKSGIGPNQLVLLLPEFIRDVKRLYRIINAQGRHRIKTLPKWAFKRKEWLENAFVIKWCTDDDHEQDDIAHQYECPNQEESPVQTRFEQRIDDKDDALDSLFPAFLLAVQRLSRADAEGDLFAREHALAAVEEAFKPFRAAFGEVTDVNLKIFFDPKKVAFYEEAKEQLGGLVLVKMLERLVTLAKEEIKKAIVKRIEEKLDKLIEKVKQKATPLIRFAEKRIAERMDIVKEKLGEDPFENFLDSTFYMYNYNSAVGVLANRQVAIAEMKLEESFGDEVDFSGPVSFDASYQVPYNQLVVCDKLKPRFYPCGLTAIEMMQPDYRQCRAAADDDDFDARLGDIEREPQIECHDGTFSAFTDDPSRDACRPRSFDDVVAHEVGSYSYAFPPEYAPNEPECVLEYDGKSLKGKGDWAPDDEDYSVGCGVSPTMPSGALALLSLLLLVAWLRSRRR